MFTLIEEIGVKVIGHVATWYLPPDSIYVYVCTPHPLLMHAYPPCMYCVYLVTYSV